MCDFCSVRAQRVASCRLPLRRSAGSVRGIVAGIMSQAGKNGQQLDNACMVKHIEVIYTHGVFRPTAPLELPLEEGQHLTLILPENGAEMKPVEEDEDLRQWCAD